MTDPSGRAKKSGIGYDIQKKLEASYDREEEAGTPEAIRAWINAIVEGQHDPCPNSSQPSLHEYLKNGVALCKMINVLLASEQKSKVPFQKKVANNFVAMGNIKSFNDGCEAYGMKKEDLFQSGDLVEGLKGPFLNIVNSLHTLGCLANTKGYSVTYTGQLAPKSDME